MLCLHWSCCTVRDTYVILARNRRTGPGGISHWTMGAFYAKFSVLAPEFHVFLQVSACLFHGSISVGLCYVRLWLVIAYCYTHCRISAAIPVSLSSLICSKLRSNAGGGGGALVWTPKPALFRAQKGESSALMIARSP